MNNNLYKEFKKMITEEKEVSYDYGCVMLELDITKEKWETITSKVNKDDIYNGSETDKDKYGLENEPHITLLYGLHSSEILDSKLHEVVKEFSNVEIILDKISIFENENYDVLKFEVVNDDLSNYNKKLKELPHTSNFPDYKAHATIGYLKPGEGKKYIGTLNDDESIKVKGKKILYSKPNEEEYIKYEI